MSTDWSNPFLDTLPLCGVKIIEKGNITIVKKKLGGMVSQYSPPISLTQVDNDDYWLNDSYWNYMQEGDSICIVVTMVFQSKTKTNEIFDAIKLIQEAMDHRRPRIVGNDE